MEALTLGVFATIGIETHESVHFGNDDATGLRAIVAIHSTVLGPSLGGTRFYPYASEDEALIDVLRLSKGMTYKAACAGLAQGGGKAVIIGDRSELATPDLFRAYGRFIEGLGGRYITAEDVGTTVADMEIVSTETEFVSGLARSSGGSGDPSPATARGVIAAMTAIGERLWGTADLRGRRVAIKGVGKVGMSLAERLHTRGAEIVVADVDDRAAAHAGDRFGAKIVPVEDVHRVDCDIFSPCALGADLNPDTIPELACSAVAGSANNQLLTVEDAKRIAERGILYAPDFVVNAGGIINIAAERGGYDPDRAAAMIDAIHDNLTEVFRIADEQGINTEHAAEAMADARIDTARRAKGATP
jgi:leucine dehydrogenase